MSTNKTTKIWIIPIIIILILLAILGLYDFGFLGRYSYHSDLHLKTVAFDSSELTVVNVDSFSQNLLLVNKTYPIGPDFVADVDFYKDTDVTMNVAIIEDYSRLSAYIRENIGDNLYVSSSYRSYEDQVRIYEEYGPSIAATPGESEHQTGLSLDVYVMNFGGSAFIKSVTGRFVNQSCSEFGFIIRYPEGQEDITGFEYEPWHIRYVGQPHATLISDNGLTLEEYISYFKPGIWYSYGNFLISRQDASNIVVPTEYLDSPIVYSPDNLGYVFVTISI